MIPGRAALVMPWRIIAGPECLHARDYTPHRCMDKAWSRAWPWMSLPAMAVSPAGHALIGRSAGPPREPGTASRPGFSTPPHVPQRGRDAALDQTAIIWNPLPFMGGVRVIDSPGMVIFSDFGPKPPSTTLSLRTRPGAYPPSRHGFLRRRGARACPQTNRCGRVLKDHNATVQEFGRGVIAIRKTQLYLNNCATQNQRIPSAAVTISSRRRTDTQWLATRPRRRPEDLQRIRFRFDCGSWPANST